MKSFLFISLFILFKNLRFNILWFEIRGLFDLFLLLIRGFPDPLAEAGIELLHDIQRLILLLGLHLFGGFGA